MNHNPGIALPKWISEGRNNNWVLGAYGLVFGVALPALVVCLRKKNSIHLKKTLTGTLVVR